MSATVTSSDRCPTCDRIDCLALAISRGRRRYCFDKLEEAARDCAINAVDWRARALVAEAKLRDLEHEFQARVAEEVEHWRDRALMAEEHLVSVLCEDLEPVRITIERVAAAIDERWANRPLGSSMEEVPRIMREDLVEWLRSGAWKKPPAE